MINMHTVLFELELIRTGLGHVVSNSEDSDEHNNHANNGQSNGNDNSTNDAIPPLTVPTDRRGSQGLRSILLQGQLFYIKDIDSLVFLCSPL